MDSLIKLLKQSDQVIILTHIFPDGDALGSAVALKSGLEQLGKTAVIVLTEKPDSTFDFLETEYQILQEEETNLQSGAAVIAIDVGDSDRTGYPEIVKRAAAEKKLGLIDHHPVGDIHRLTSFRHTREKAAASAELVYEIIQKMDLRLTSRLSTALLAGLFTDTGGFQHENTSPTALNLAAELMRRGGKLQEVRRHISADKSLAHLKLVGLALERLRTVWQGKMAVSYISHSDLQRLKVEQNDLSGIISNLNVLPGAKVTLLLLEIEPGKIKGILRSTPGSPTMVHLLGRLLGGGGHPRASGFSLNGSLRIYKDGNCQIEEKSLK